MGAPVQSPVKAKSQKWSVRQKLLSADGYRDWAPKGQTSYATPGRGMSGESQN